MVPLTLPPGSRPPFKRTTGGQPSGPLYDALLSKKVFPQAVVSGYCSRRDYEVPHNTSPVISTSVGSSKRKHDSEYAVADELPLSTDFARKYFYCGRK